MRLIILMLIAAPVISDVAADDKTIGLNLVCCSYHLDNRDEWEQVNPGVVVSYKPYRYLTTIAGGYYNSEGSASFLVGAGPRLPIGKHVEFSLPMGLISGYSEGYGFALPTVSIRPWEKRPLAINLHYVPEPPGRDGGSAAVALSVQVYEWSF